MNTSPRRFGWPAWAPLTTALLVLNAALTFENVWPTPAVWWAGGLSVELAVCLLVLIAAVVTRRSLATGTVAAWLAAAWTAAAIARYAEVTAPALYGRDVNLYWDLRLMPDVAAMITRVAPWWLVALAVGVALAILWLVHRVFRWAFSRVLAGLADGSTRRRIAGASATVILLFAAQSLGARIPGSLPSPVVATCVRQAGLVLAGWRGTTSLPPSPSMESTFANVEGADVFLVFIESYGAVSNRPDVAARLADSRRQLAADIHESGRQAASAYVESPTFGGSSWLAHISLLSGIEVRDPDTNAMLMTQRRDTLARSFARRGFRTVALMPGLRQQWPEGTFYGFDEIYGADRLAYVGPEFGWFALPDQFSLAKLDILESAVQSGKPRFVFFPTISTHFPFSPTPPYQPDWGRMMDAHPYDGPSIVRAYARQPDWTNFTPGYVEAIAYDFAVLGGYLKRHADRDIVMILIGDHQPPAAVSGEGASWNVPVHIVTSRATLLDRFTSRGFRNGLQPSSPALCKMNLLLPLLLDAFGGHD
jgi:hypothetical protein